MTRHQLLVRRKAASDLQKLLMESADFDDLSELTVFWLGKVCGTLSGAIHQIDQDLEAGTPPRL